MANVARTGVTFLQEFLFGGMAGKELVVRRVSMVLATNGSMAAGELIPAAALGLQSIVASFSANESTSLLNYNTAPSFDGANLLFLDGTGGQAEANPVSVTGTFRVTVIGPPA